MFSSEYKSNKHPDRSNRSKRRRSSAGASIEQQNKEPKTNHLRAIIIDSGAYSIKIGHSKDENPSIIPNCIMKAKSERKRMFIGAQIDECRDCSGLYFLLPCERGYITKWDVQKPVWDHVLSKNVCPINNNPVVLTQPLFNFKSIQDCIDEIFFEEYEVPSLFRLNPTDLARLKYAAEFKLSDKDPCLIIDTGFSFTHIIPYINGNKYLKGIKRLNVGGKLLTNHLKDIISYRQYNVMEETYIINQVKEDTCYVAEDVRQELKKAARPFSSNEIVKNYVLPDFNNIRRGYIQDVLKPRHKELEENCQILRLNNERFIVPEILFHPSDIGMKSMGIAEAAVKSILACPKNAQEDLAKHIVLIGGNCNFPGFKQRMYAELRSLLPHLWEVNVYQPSDPTTYAWKGGSKLLKVPDFKSFFVTKGEYEELGSSIIQQRFNSWMSDNSEEQEESKKEREKYKYLDKLKSRSIFGKQEVVNNSNGNPGEGEKDGETASTTNQGTENTSDSPIPNENKEESNQTSEETSQDSFPSAESEKISRKAASKNAKSKVVEEDSIFESEDEDDLTQSVELFPFGTGSYL